MDNEGKKNEMKRRKETKLGEKKNKSGNGSTDYIVCSR
jgi:hypothetical protein